MKRTIIISLCVMITTSVVMAQEEAKSGGILQKVKKFADATVVHGVDTNYIKTPEQPWQVSIKSRVAQTDLQMHSTIDGGELLDGE